MSTIETKPDSTRVPLWRFSLAELMVFTALLAICFSVWSVDPVASIMLAVYSQLASIRTMAAKRLAQRQGVKLSVPRQVFVFIKSALWVYLGLHLSGMAVAVLAVPVILLYPRTHFTNNDPVLWLVLICSVLAFFYVQFRFLKATWPK